jgi:pilus assembly protein FimV
LKSHTLISGRFALSGVTAAILCLAVPAASALGLGKLAVQSALGESLRAEIEVTSMTPEEASNLRIQIAPPEAYRTANVDYNPVLPGTRASLQRRADGRQFIHLVSDRGVQEPFVDVILEISWASGRLVREYTLLFDPPPAIRAGAPKPATPEPAAPPATAVALSPMPQAQPAPVRTQRRAEPRPLPEAEPRPLARTLAPAVDEYEVKSGDSLSRIASRTQRPGASLDQMLVALYRANPQAFQNENMNRLKAGVVLTVPSAETAQAVAPAEARQVIIAQSADFAAYRQRLASGVPAAAAERDARQASGKVEAAVEDRKQAAVAAPDKLTLTKGAAKAQTEERISREQERKASAVQVAELSRNVDELKKMASAAAAAASQTAVLAATAGPAAQAQQTAHTAPMAGQPTIAAPSAMVAATTPPVATGSAPAEPVVAAASVAATSATPAVAAASAAAAKKPEPVVAKAAEPLGQLGSLMDDNRVSLGLGALLVALLAGFGVYRFSKRAKKDSGETSFLESRLQPDSFFGASGGQRIDTRDAAASSSSMTYSLSQLDAIGDVDPVAEADVYLAYGRDLQAEEILKEAMRSSPERMAIRTKLLEVYAKRRDTKGFELLATQLYALTHGVGEDWAKAQELGVQIDPENPLFRPGGAPAGVAPDEVTEPLGASTMPHTVAPGAADYQSSLAATAAFDSAVMDLDLDLDDPETGESTSPGILEATQALAPVVAEDEAPHLATHRMGLVANEPQEPDLRDEPLSFDLSGISLDLDAPAAEGSAQGAAVLEDDSFPPVSDDDDLDPVSRKLELAEEFRQIGDADGARDLLREVLSSATGAARTKAQGMLDDLG